MLDKYCDDPNVDPAQIVEVDFALQEPGRPIRTLSEVSGRNGPFDWVVACHVIEHVPDLIAWFDELARVTVDGGHLVLIIPDRRFTFDALRSRTTTGQILQAHTAGDVVPSERAVYDHFRSYVDASARDLWSGRLRRTSRETSASVASQLRTQVLETGGYIDSHVWTFTPAEFVEQLDELGTLGYCNFVVARIEPTLVDDLEFLVLLRRIPRGATPDHRMKAQDSAISGLVDAPSASRRWTRRLPSPSIEASSAGPTASMDSGTSGLLVSERELRLITMKRRLMGALRSLLGSGRVG